MDLQHIKLQNGDDLIAYVEDHNEFYRIHTPIKVYIDPKLGYLARSWISLSRASYVDVAKRDVVFHSIASNDAVNYYQEFVEFINSDQQTINDLADDIDDDQIAEMLNSKNYTKH